MIFLNSQRKCFCIFLLIVAAVASRVFYIQHHYDPFNGDGVEYQQCAQLFMQGHWIDPIHPCTAHPPGFAALLALEYAVFGVHPAVGIAVNLLITLGGIWIAGLLAVELAGEKAGWIALVLGVVYYDSIRYGEVLLADHAFNFLVAAGVLFLARSEKRKDWIIGTVLLGLSGWFRAITEPLALWLPLCIFLREGRDFKALKKSVFYLGLFLLSLSPIIIRNSLAQRRLVGAATEGGFTFWASNYPGSKGDWNPSGIPWQDPHFSAMPEAQREKAYYSEGFQSLRHQPIAMIVKREIFKIFGMLYPFLPEYDYSFVFCLPFFLLALAGPALFKKQRRPKWDFIYMAVFNTLFVTLLFNGYPRARTPLNWIIISAAAVGLQAAWQNTRNRAWIGVWGIFNLGLWAAAEPLRLWLKAALKY